MSWLYQPLLPAAQLLSLVPVTITPDVSAVSITGSAPTLGVGIPTQTAAASLSVNAPTLDTGLFTQISAISTSGLQSSLGSGLPTQASATSISGVESTLGLGLFAQSAALSISEIQPVLDTGISTQIASLSIDGIESTLGFDLSTQVGSITIDGKDASTLLESFLTAGAGSVEIVGAEAQITEALSGSIIFVSGPDLTISGIQPKTDSGINAQSGSILLDGKYPILNSAEALSPDAGALTISGIESSLGFDAFPLSSHLSVICRQLSIDTAIIAGAASLDISAIPVPSNGVAVNLPKSPSVGDLTIGGEAPILGLGISVEATAVQVSPIVSSVTATGVISVVHKFVSAVPDCGDTSLVQPSNWNDTHTIVGVENYLGKPGASGQVLSSSTNGDRVWTDPNDLIDHIEDLSEASLVDLSDRVTIRQTRYGAPQTVSATIAQIRDAVFGDDWDDLVIPATAVNPTGLASPPALNGDTGCLEFAGNADNTICGCWQLPHGWTGAITDGAYGKVVCPHLHVRFLTSSATNTRWKLEIDRVTVNGIHENVYGSFTDAGTITVANPQNVNQSSLVSLADIDMTGYTKGSALIHFRLSRLALSDGADNFTGLVALYSMDLHIQRRAAGSEYEVPGIIVPLVGSLDVSGHQTTVIH